MKTRQLFLFLIIFLFSIISFGVKTIIENPVLPSSIEINCTIPDYVKGPFPTIETQFIESTPEYEEMLKVVLFGSDYFTLRSKNHVWEMRSSSLDYMDSRSDDFWRREADDFVSRARQYMPESPVRLDYVEVMVSFESNSFPEGRTIHGKLVRYKLMFKTLPIYGERVNNHVRFEDEGGGGYAINIPVVRETGETLITVSPRQAIGKYIVQNPNVDIIDTVELCYFYELGMNGNVPLCYKIIGGQQVYGHYHREDSYIPATR